MKNLICSLGLILSLLFISIIIQSCSSENGITSPPESKTTSLAKTTVIPSGTLDFTTDTMIVLPKSGKKVVISKKYSAAMIAQMDIDLKNHTKININPNITIKPDAVCPNCSLYVMSGWVLFDDYRPAPGKNMGISPLLSTETPQYCLQWGFNQIFISGTGYTNNYLNQYQAVHSAGYADQNIGVWLPWEYLYDADSAVSIIKAGPKIGFYLIDEPFENSAYSADYVNQINTKIAPAVQNLNSNSKLVLTSWRATTAVTCELKAASGNTLKNLIANNFPNTVCIVCDQYHGNCCGNAGDFWNDYAGYYGTILNPTNFMDVLINNGGGNGDCSTNGFTSSDFHALFTNYESHGDNTAWLYAGTPHAPSDVQNFITNVAVTPQVQWEQQLAVQYFDYWANTDCTCDLSEFPNGWIEYNFVYTNGKYVYLPYYGN